jgi:hypothetical protein
VVLIESYTRLPHVYRDIELTALGLHRGPDPEGFIRLDVGLRRDKDVVPLTGLYSRGLASG